jgi:hypothetical protein
MTDGSSRNIQGTEAHEPRLVKKTLSLADSFHFLLILTLIFTVSLLGACSRDKSISDGKSSSFDAVSLSTLSSQPMALFIVKGNSKSFQDFRSSNWAKFNSLFPSDSSNAANSLAASGVNKELSQLLQKITEKLEGLKLEEQTEEVSLAVNSPNLRDSELILLFKDSKSADSFFTEVSTSLTSIQAELEGDTLSFEKSPDQISISGLGPNDTKFDFKIKKSGKQIMGASTDTRIEQMDTILTKNEAVSLDTFPELAAIYKQLRLPGSPFYLFLASSDLLPNDSKNTLLPVHSIGAARGFNGEVFDRAFVQARENSKFASILDELKNLDALPINSQDGDVLRISFSLQALSTLIDSAEENLKSKAPEILSKINSLSWASISARKAEAGGFMPSFSLELSGEELGSVKALLKSSLASGLSTSGIPVSTKWQKQAMGEREAEFLMSPIAGLGVYLLQTESTLFVATSLESLQNSSKNQAQTNPTDSLLNFSLNFSNASDAVKSLESTLALFTGGEPLVPQSQLQILESLGRIDYQLQVKDSSLYLSGESDSVHTKENKS